MCKNSIKGNRIRRTEFIRRVCRLEHSKFELNLEIALIIRGEIQSY